MRKELRTKRGYDFYEVASSLQKAIRRNDPATAGYFALELFESGFHKYAWKRLLTICAEDVGVCVNREITSLRQSFDFVNEGRKKWEKPKGRIFISKAVLLLCAAPKSRDADHLQNFVYDKKMISDDKIETYFEEVRKHSRSIPGYAYDVHTKRGKAMGKTKSDFFREEQASLDPFQPGLFDNLIQ